MSEQPAAVTGSGASRDSQNGGEQVYQNPPPYGNNATSGSRVNTTNLASAVQVQPQDEVADEKPVRDWLALSILVTICCSLPLGVAAIIYSVETRSATKARDYMRAMNNSRKAKILNVCGIVIGSVFTAIWLIVYFL